MSTCSSVSSPKQERRSPDPDTPSQQRLLNFQERADDHVRRRLHAEEESTDQPGGSRPISSNSSRLLLLVNDGALTQEEYEAALLDIEAQFVQEFPEARPVWIQGLSTASRRKLLARVSSHLLGDWQLPPVALDELKIEWGFNEVQCEAARLWALGVNMYVAPSEPERPNRRNTAPLRPDSGLAAVRGRSQKRHSEPPGAHVISAAAEGRAMDNQTAEDGAEVGPDYDAGSGSWGLGIAQHYKTLMRRTLSRADRAANEVLRTHS